MSNANSLLACRVLWLALPPACLESSGATSFVLLVHRARPRLLRFQLRHPSQRRRHLVRDAHRLGKAPGWDFQPSTPEDSRWYRGHGNYNDWAMDYLPHGRTDPD